MKHLIFILIFIFSFLGLKNKGLALEISCTHHQVCNLMHEILKKNQNNNQNQITIKQIVVVQGDPHHFEPSPHDIKNLINTDHLILPPFELQPWLKKIIINRKSHLSAKKFDQQTIQLALPPKIINHYQQSSSSDSTEALAHFWLYPKLICPLQEELSSQLKKWNLNFDHNKNNKSHHECLKNITKMDQDLLALFKKEIQIDQNTVIILSHDALAPLLESYGMKVISLRGSHHHEEISPKKLKEIQELTQEKSDSKRNSKNLIWILEKDSSHQSLWALSQKRSGDKVIVLDLEGQYPRPISEVLQNFLNKIK